MEERLHPTAWTGETAVEFIHHYKDDKPLFLKVSFARPHSPYDPPQRYLDMYKDAPVPEPVIGEWAAPFANYPKSKDAAFGDYGVEHAVESRRHYYANITFIDDQIGEIIRALKEEGLYDNSVIIFVSDHGDMLGDHYHWRKTYPYEGSSHVPFLLRLPEQMKMAVKPGAHLDYPVELRDIYRPSWMLPEWKYRKVWMELPCCLWCRAKNRSGGNISTWNMPPVTVPTIIGVR